MSPQGLQLFLSTSTITINAVALLLVFDATRSEHESEVDLGGSDAADVTVPCERGAYSYQVDAGKRSVLQQEHRHAQ